MVKRNETTVTNRDAGSKAQESKSHDLVKEPSFPLGSIGKGKSWQAEGDYEHFEEGDHPYVGLAPGASLWQDITLPVEANPVEGGRPDFWLGCEYDTGRLTDCWLAIYDFTGGKEGTLLDKRAMEGIQPEASDALVNWTLLPLLRIENLDRTITAIRMKFIAGKGNNRLNLRNTDLDVRLPALAATLRLVVDPDGLKIEQTAPPYKFCHGAVHRFGISDLKTESWLHQKASLSWHGATLPTEHELQSKPPFNRGTADEESFQPLEEVTAWSVSSNAKPDAISGALALGITSYWQAEIREIAASVGDYVNDLSAIAGGDSALVIDDESANKTTLTTTVFNHFAPERKVEKIPVEWWVNGRSLGTVPTDQQGRSQIDYKPEKGDEGDANQAEITAIVKNEVGEASRQVKSLRVFTTSPWLDQVQVWLDDEEVDLKNLGLHLSRGDKARKLFLQPKAIPGNFFIGRDLTLDSPGDSAGKLGIIFSPSTPRKMSENGALWSIWGGSTSGHFSFEAKATGLSVPFVLKGLQMSKNLSDEADLTVSDATPSGAPLFWRKQAGTVALLPKKDSPLAGLGLETWLRFVKGNLEQSSVPASPAYETKRSLMAAGLQWSLTGGATSGAFGLEIHVEGFTKPWVVSKAVLLSQNLNDEAEIQLPQSPMLFQRAASQVVTVAVKGGSPLTGLGFEAAMKFLDGTVKQANMSASPAFGTLNPLTLQGELLWSLTGGNVSGTFGFEISVKGFNVPLRLEVGKALLMSATLRDEAEIKIEGSIPNGTVVFNRNKTYKVELVPKTGSPLGLSRLDGWSAIYMPSKPERMFEQEITPDGLTWVVTAPGSSTRFDLNLHMRGFTDNGVVIKDCLVLAEDLSEEVEIQIAGSIIEGKRCFWRKTLFGIGLVPRRGSPLGGGGVEVDLRFIDSESDMSKSEFVVGPAFNVPQTISNEGCKWTLLPSDRSGYFTLEVGSTLFAKPMTLGKGFIFSKFLADEAEIFVKENEPGNNVFYRVDGSEILGLVPKSGSWLAELSFYKSFLSFKSGGSLVSSQVVFMPAYEAPASWVRGGWKWSQGASVQSGTFALEVTHELLQGAIRLEKCYLLSDRLENEARVEDPGYHRVTLRPGQTDSNKFVITWSPDSLLVQLGVELSLVEITGDVGSGVVVTNPPLQAKVKMDAKGRAEWTVTAAKVGSVDIGLLASKFGRGYPRVVSFDVS